MKQFRDTPYYVTENGEVYRLWKIGFKKRKSHFNNDGYCQITFCINRNIKHYLIHRLVAELYIPNPNNLPEVNHDDGDKTNNNISNLYWCTPSQNIKHAHRTGLIKPAKGQQHSNSKLTEEQVKWIRKNYIPRHKEFGTRGIGRKYNVSHIAILKIIKNKCWSHLNPEQS